MAVECRKSLNQINNYTPAKTIESVKRELGLTSIIKLAGNENNLGCSPLVKEAISAAFGELSRYPDVDCTQLKDKLSGILHIKNDQLIFGNGSFELLSLIAQTFINHGEESIIPEPSFGWYKVATLANSGTVINVPLRDNAVDLNAVKSKVNEKTRVIWLCNPNNPTGTFFDEDSLSSFLESLPEHILVVLDEAYFEYVDDKSYPDTVKLLERYHNIIILRTFSKVYGLASLRIGYGISSPEIISYLNKIRLPINVNMLAQVAALASLDDINFKQAVLDNNRRGKKLYYDTLDEMGLTYIPTQCNFIMINTGIDSDYVVNEYLKKGYLIRGGKEFGMPTWLRITIGKYEENVLVLDILREILRKHG